MFILFSKYTEPFNFNNNINIKNKIKNSNTNLFKEKFLSEDIIYLANKNNYKELNNSQKYRSFNIKSTKGENYNYKFILNVENTGDTETFLFCRNFSKLPQRQILLWVCSIKCENIGFFSYSYIGDVDWHFIVVENIAEFTKHKGLINKLTEDDLIIAAGEFYIQNSGVILWNDQSGTLKNMNKLNSQIIGGSFREIIISQMLEFHKSYIFKYTPDIINKYSSEITFYDLDKFHVSNRFYKSNKKLLDKI